MNFSAKMWSQNIPIMYHPTSLCDRATERQESLLMILLKNICKSLHALVVCARLPEDKCPNGLKRMCDGTKKNKDHKTLLNISTGDGAAVLVTSQKFFALPVCEMRVLLKVCKSTLRDNFIFRSKSIK